MSIAAAYGPKSFGLSFELFPPKTTKGEDSLMRHTRRLAEFRPRFITCTYGAGGSTQDTTLQVVTRVRRELRVPVATHLTCVGRTREQLHAFVQRAVDEGVENVVALRGDPPQGESEFRHTPGGFRYANELVAMIRQGFPKVGIAVAGYPETHREAPSPQADLENLKRKVDAGANAVITQLFYDNADFFRFCDRCDEIGLGVPVVPGLMPITNSRMIKKITSLCAARLPRELVERLERAGDDEAQQVDVGVEFATRQTAELLERGVPGIHFYVLNKSEATSRVLSAVSLPE